MNAISFYKMDTVIHLYDNEHYVYAKVIVLLFYILFHIYYISMFHMEQHSKFFLQL